MKRDSKRDLIIGAHLLTFSLIFTSCLSMIDTTSRRNFEESEGSDTSSLDLQSDLSMNADIRAEFVRAGDEIDPEAHMGGDIGGEQGGLDGEQGGLDGEQGGLDGEQGGLDGEQGGLDGESCISRNELCDGLDNDCDDAIDERVTNACGQCGAPPVEVCDELDNDCDKEPKKQPTVQAPF